MRKLPKTTFAALSIGVSHAKGAASKPAMRSFPTLGAVIVVLLAVVAVSTALPSQDDPAPVRSTAPVMLGFELKQNLCANATITSTSKALAQESLQKSIDGMMSTGFDASLLQGASLEIDFRGRPPWLNVVSIVYQGEMDFRILVKDIYGNEKEIAFDLEKIDQGEGVTEIKLACDDIRVTSLLIEPLQERDYPDNPGALLEVEAYFVSVDPDDGIAEVGSEWIKKYKGTACGGHDVKNRKADAQSFSGKLRDKLGWRWNFDWGNSLAWEYDFSEEGHPWDVDEVDFCYFSGHGFSGGFWFSDPILDCAVQHGECQGEWGNSDMEWIAISTCHTLAKSQWAGWFGCFNGLHLMCGMRSSALDFNAGKYIGNRLVDGKTIPQAWFKGVKEAHRPWYWRFDPKKRKAVVIAEVFDNFKDHAYGAGYVSPDPVHDNLYHWMMYTFWGAKSSAPEPTFDRSAARLIAVSHRETPAILVSEEMLTRTRADSIPRLIVTPRTVDYTYVVCIADSFCNNYGIFCGVDPTDVFFDDTDGIFSVYDGPHELLVNEQSGGWDYIQSETYAIPTQSPPSLLDSTEAQSRTHDFLLALEFLPPDAVPYGASWLHQGMHDCDLGVDIADSSWNLSIVNGFYRVHNGYEVAGPGADVQVEYGDDGELQSVNHGGWRDVAGGANVATISLEEALENLAYCGTELAIGSMPLCDTFLVIDAELGYFEGPADSLIDELAIVWIVNGYSVFSYEGETDTNACELLLPACEGCQYGAICPPTIEIGKTHNTYQGQYEWVSLTTQNSMLEMGGFDFLIAYDASALTFAEATPGQLLDDCGWEYFTYRYGVQGNCGDACPSGLLRIIAIAETNNGPNHPSCYGPPDTDPHELAEMKFLVTNDRTFECMYVPIYFFWDDCADNAISSVDGSQMYIDRAIYDFEGNLIWDEDDDDLFPEDARLPHVGAPDFCVDIDVEKPIEKPAPIRFIDFRNGGIDIICADSIDDRGDINLNGVANEIADAVLFSNYFVYGLSVFTINVEGQIAATDVNVDGLTLSVADLVYLIRVVVGDALPYPKLAPVVAKANVTDGVVSVDVAMGAAYVVVEGNTTPTLLAENMDMKYNYDGEQDLTRILVYSMEPGQTFEGDFLKGIEGEIITLEMATYEGAPVTAKVVPTDFALHQNYPNPFNPITTISFGLPLTTDYELVIYNTLGQRVAAFEGNSEPGIVRVDWDASDFASGVYYYSLTAGKFSDTKKMVLIK